MFNFALTTILAENSSVLADMFSVDKPAGLPVVEDLPVVQLHDNLDDLEVVLKAVYSSKWVTSTIVMPAQHSERLGFRFFHVDESHEWSTLRAVTRLEVKYDLTILLADVKRVISRAFPDTLDGWDKLYVDKSAECPIKESRNHLFEILGVIHELVVRLALPAFYFHVCLLFTLSEIMRAGFSTEDIFPIIVGRTNILAELEPRGLFVYFICGRQTCDSKQKDLSRIYNQNTASRTLDNLLGREDVLELEVLHLGDCQTASSKATAVASFHTVGGQFINAFLLISDCRNGRFFARVS
jgi:hypothetical protein